MNISTAIVKDKLDACVERVADHRDQAAFIMVFNYYAPRVKSYLMRNNCTPSVAEEITQEVMTTLWHKAHLFDRRKSSLGTWLFRVARNKRIDLIRADKSDRLDPKDPTMFPTVTETDQLGPDAFERDHRIRKAIDALPVEQMSLIRASFFDNKPHSQIADELNLPLGTVKSRIRLAFTRLRKMLEEDVRVDVD